MKSGRNDLHARESEKADDRRTTNIPIIKKLCPFTHMVVKISTPKFINLYRKINKNAKNAHKIKVIKLKSIKRFQNNRSAQ